MTAGLCVGQLSPHGAPVEQEHAAFGMIVCRGGKHKMGKTFKIELCITGTANAEWQGTLRPENGESTDFRSVLELIKEISKSLKAAETETTT